jgi:uncharacterized protein
MPVSRRMILSLASVATLNGGLCATAWAGQKRLLFPAPDIAPVTLPPDGELWQLRDAEGVAVHALAFLPPGARRVVVGFHGNGEVMEWSVARARRFLRAGVGVVLVEYRGYGRSRGENIVPSEPGFYADGETVLAELRRRGFGPSAVTLWGTSIGTGVASEMAARGHGSALVLVCPFTSLVAMGRKLAPFLPVSLLLRDRFDTLAKAPNLRIPALVVHGTEDELIPLAMGRAVAEALPNARFVEVQGGHHNDLYEREDVLATLVAFLHADSAGTVVAPAAD